MQQAQKVVNRFPAGVVRAPQAAAALTPRDVLLILRRHIWLIISATVIGFVCGGVAWFLLLRYLPKYTAAAYLKVLSPVERDPWLIGGPVVQEQIQYNFRASIAAMIMQQSTLEALLDRDKIRQTKWFRQFAEYDEQGNIINRDECIRKAFEDLQDNFVAHPERNQEFVLLKMTCGSKEEAALIVNEMQDLFLAKQGVTQQSDVASRLASYRQREASVKADLVRIQGELDDIARRYPQLTGLSELEQSGGRYFQNPVTRQFNDLELQEQQLLLQIRQVQAAIGEFQELATGPVPVQIANRIKEDPVMLALDQRLAVLQSVLRGSLTRFGENHRVVRDTKRQIQETELQRQARMREVAELTRQGQLGDAQDQLVVLQERLKELQKLRDDVLASQRDLDVAQRLYARKLEDKQERQETLNTIKEQIEKLSVMHDDPKTRKVESMGRALAPLDVSSPRWELYFPGGTVLGLLLGVGLAFMLETVNDLVRTPRDVGRYLDVAVLAVVPAQDEDDQADDVDPYHVVRQAPYSIISEAYTRLRTNLSLSAASHDDKVLLITSGLPEEGKSAVASNLATTLVAQNKKVLLIDANFRRPVLHKVFERPGTSQGGYGLSSLLAGLCELEAARRSNVIQGLDLIEAGPLPGNPTELLGSHRMKQLLSEQRKNYDYIIIDSSPVLLVSDSKLLARMADGTIVVLNAGTTRRGAARRTIEELRQVNTSLAGCVLFAARAIKGGYFRQQFRTYQQYQPVQG